MDNPRPVIHALGGRYLYSKVPDIVDNFASALSEAVGCPEMMVLHSQIPPPPKPSRGRGQRGGNRRGRGGRGGTAESSRIPPHTPPATSRELFAPPYAAFLEAPSHKFCDRFFCQQTFLKDKVTMAHIIPAINKHRNWTVQTTFAATGNLDDQVFAFLNTFDLHLQEYEYCDGRTSQRRWVLYAALILMAENLFVREQQEDEIRSYIRKQTYSHGIYLVHGTTMNCSLCKARNHNRFACPFTEHKDWQGPDANENVKEIARCEWWGFSIPGTICQQSWPPLVLLVSMMGTVRVRIPLKHKRLWMHGADQRAPIEVPGSIAQPVLSIAPGQQLHRSWTTIQTVRL
ncbi:hypothetical protein BDP27DRAFT_1376893 [Rhodocollybia butyracea]|uniref:Uncharacterized protein n=1 Tax=Rhodocollybia butyracea TaxID=206335 RepID=A0A9P5P4L3_9AGAR|nr:hypothetical protein BDP27DRAFT_1376893 [Rhodocollybia butyracea]